MSDTNNTNSKGRFGKYGGQYVPETLMNAVNELEEAYNHYKDDPEFNRELTDLLKRVADISQDVILYTGYQIKELTSDAQIKLLERIAVLIDGEYKEELNDGAFLRGSSNQIIHILSDQYRDKYEKYIRGNHNEIQNFMINNEVISVGIHNKEFRF